MELLIHLNKRIRCRPEVQLPIDALLQQYQDARATSFVLVSASKTFLHSINMYILIILNSNCYSYRISV